MHIFNNRMEQQQPGLNKKPRTIRYRGFSVIYV